MPVLSFLVGLYASLYPSLHPTAETVFLDWVMDPPPPSLQIHNFESHSAPLRMLGGIAYFEIAAEPDDIKQLIEKLALKVDAKTSSVPNYSEDGPLWWNQTAFQEDCTTYRNWFLKDPGRLEGGFMVNLYVSPEQDRALAFVVADPTSDFLTKSR